MSFNLYADSGLTTLVGASLEAIFAIGGAAAKKTVYLGSTNAAIKLQRQTSPGVNPIQVDIVDANTGGGQPDTAIRLATTEGGLASATPGGTLNLPNTINGGVSNAKAIWLDFTDTGGVVGTFTDLSLALADLYESAI